MLVFVENKGSVGSRIRETNKNNQGESMNRLINKVAIITGSSSGIGRGIASAFAKEGAITVLASRRKSELEITAEQIGKEGSELLVVPTDVTREEEVERLFKKSVESFGRVDILINSAGISASGPTEDLTLKVWRNVLAVNLTGAFLCSREALRIMQPRCCGRIINVGSVSAKVPRTYSAAYTTSKFGLEGLTRSMALDAREYGISVSVLHPGNTNTQLWEGREEIAEREGVMDPYDVARAVTLMASLPKELNMIESTILPVSMPFLGRG